MAYTQLLSLLLSLSQLYLSFKPTPSEQPGSIHVAQIEACISEIDLWIVCSKLKLNRRKTELLISSVQHHPPPLIVRVHRCVWWMDWAISFCEEHWELFASNRCNLCLWEKYFIIGRPELGTLNKQKCSGNQNFRCAGWNLQLSCLLDIAII